MIVGGDEVNGVTFSATKKTKILVTHGKRIREALKDDDITFTKEDADGILLPHNNAPIISLNVLDFKIKHVLVDSVPATKLLVWFNLRSVMTRGEILLPTHAEGVTKTTQFEEVDEDMGYNVILGRPWIHEMKVVPSTYQQLLKFPTPNGVKQFRGDQLAAREMNTGTLSSSKGKEASK
ncbi:PREDICTED: uncharacterized protein LOC109217466 [Nicotiana attenuata]|uniref:uncharacterized protein LOC109217466 n=1 Tax=Nicotiana attenuata TaxID=49451 RepID=UPI000904C36D|nr:PREDICTED: uncharacterized protein LOC109217466 [Nicotiana attenuata]